MPYTWVEPDVFLEYNGVTVYYAYKNGNAEDWLDFHFATDMESTDDEVGGNGTYDVRGLARLVGEDVPDANDDTAKRRILKAAIDKSLVVSSERS